MNVFFQQESTSLCKKNSITHYVHVVPIAPPITLEKILRYRCNEKVIDFYIILY